ncbi:LAFA_0D14488g1_1 [Lachancea sp. 'fantastica']|nr:LAFA_0D14488g1_1 [Lachancea sp. 'fantastica']
MTGIVRYIPKSSLWLCPMFLIGSDLITNLYGGDKGRASVTRQVQRKGKKLLASRRPRRQDERSNAGRGG